MELWIIRHGETKANVEKVLQGHQGGELTERGIEQCIKLGQRLSQIKFTEVIVSDLNRTKQTAEYVTAHHKYAPIRYDSRLRERNCGILEGRSCKIISELAKKKNVSRRKFKPIEGESGMEVYQRSKQLLKELIQKYVRSEYSDNNSQFNPNLNTPSKEENINHILQNTTLIRIESEINKGLNNANFDEYVDENVSTMTVPLTKPFGGFTQKSDFNRVLLISHGGFIYETINVLQDMKGLKIYNNLDTHNTGLFVIRIYCSQCGSSCNKISPTCSFWPLEYDFLVTNDITHLIDE